MAMMPSPGDLASIHYLPSPASPDLTWPASPDLTWATLATFPPNTTSLSPASPTLSTFAFCQSVPWLVITLSRWLSLEVRPLILPWEWACIPCNQLNFVIWTAICKPFWQVIVGWVAQCANLDCMFEIRRRWELSACKVETKSEIGRWGMKGMDESLMERGLTVEWWDHLLQGVFNLFKAIYWSNPFLHFLKAFFFAFWTCCILQAFSLWICVFYQAFSLCVQWRTAEYSNWDWVLESLPHSEPWL